MKSIFRPPEIEFSGTNDQKKRVRDKMQFVVSRPFYLLLVIWIGYAILDGAHTYLSDLDTPGAKFALITLLFGVIASYVYFFWLIPALFYRRFLLRFVGMSTLVIAIISAVKYYLFQFFEIHIIAPLEYIDNEIERQIAFFLLTFMTWGYYALIKALLQKWETEASLDKLHIAHKNAQLSPHFTINLLSGISSKVEDINPELAEDLDQLMILLRYAYIDPEKFNPLSSEIEAIFCYLHGQKSRFPESMSLVNEIDPTLLEFKTAYMPKLLLLSLIENVFKHGDYQNSEIPVFIESRMQGMEENEPVLVFTTQNKIQTCLGLRKSGFGVETIRNLLDYYFPNSQLTTTITHNIYSLKLTIPYGDNQNWPNR
jgi:sensor histidine kinase YesM